MFLDHRGGQVRIFLHDHDLDRFSRLFVGYADRGDFRGITRVINGGTNGAADRESRYKKAKAALVI